MILRPPIESPTTFGRKKNSSHSICLTKSNSYKRTIYSPVFSLLSEPNIIAVKVCLLLSLTSIDLFLTEPLTAVCSLI